MVVLNLHTALTFFTLIRFLLYVLVARSGGRRRRGSFTAGILRSINSFGATSGRRGLDASALSALPVTTYRKEGAATAGADCAVCLSELADGEKVRELPNCGHSFHVECVDMWLRSHSTCPLCRCAVADEAPTVQPPEADPESPIFPTTVLFFGSQDAVAIGGTPRQPVPPQPSQGPIAGVAAVVEAARVAALRRLLGCGGATPPPPPPPQPGHDLEMGPAQADGESSTPRPAKPQPGS